MSADKSERAIIRNREAKVRRFCVYMDETIRDSGADPMSIEAAGNAARQLEAATDEHWTQLATALNERSSPSAETRRMVVNVYRVRAGLTELEAPKPEVPNEDALVARYVAFLDGKARTNGQPYFGINHMTVHRTDSRDPDDPRLAAAIDNAMRAWSSGRWWYRAKDIGEQTAPSEEVVRRIRNVYRERAGMPPLEPPSSTPATPAPPRTHGPECDCDDCLMASLFDPAKRAEALRDERETEERLRRRGTFYPSRFGGR